MSLSSASILARWLSCNVMNLIDSGRPKIAASANTTGAMPPKRRECEGAGGHTAAELGSRASDQFQSPKYRRSVDRIAVFGRCRRRRSVSRGVPAHTTDLRWPPPLRSQAQIQADGQGDSGKVVRGTRGCVFRKLRTNRWPSREYAACQISFRGPRNGDRARADRRYAPIGTVSTIGCEHARKLNDRGQSIRNEYGTCSSGHSP